MESSDINDNTSECEPTSYSGEELTVGKENNPEAQEDGEEIVVEYNHNDYVDLVGPLWSPLTKTVQTPSSVSLLKRPGSLPPFALFLQEQRPKMQRDNPGISFGEIGKRLGDMWQALKSEEKEVYQLKAKQITEDRRKSWMEDFNSLPLENQMLYFQQNGKSSVRGATRGGSKGARGVVRGRRGGGPIMQQRGGSTITSKGQFGRKGSRKDPFTFKLPQGTSITKTSGILMGLPNTISVSRVEQPEVEVLSEFRSTRVPCSLKRKARGGGVSIPMKRLTSTPAVPTKRPKTSKLCRVCAKEGFNFSCLAEKPAMVALVNEYLDISLDLEAEKEAGYYPNIICLKCSNFLESLNVFSKTVSRGQEIIRQTVKHQREPTVLVPDIQPDESVITTIQGKRIEIKELNMAADQKQKLDSFKEEQVLESFSTIYQVVNDVLTDNKDIMEKEEVGENKDV